MQQGTDNRSLGELFSELSRQTSTLVRQEVAEEPAPRIRVIGGVGEDVDDTGPAPVRTCCAGCALRRAK